MFSFLNEKVDFGQKELKMKNLDTRWELSLSLCSYCSPRSELGGMSIVDFRRLLLPPDLVAIGKVFLTIWVGDLVSLILY